MKPEQDSGRAMADLIHRVSLRTATVAAVFTVIVLALLLANTAASRLSDPLKPVRLEALMLELNRKPHDEALKLQVRRLDREIRTTYFKGRAFATTGFYLLLGGLTLFVLAIEATKASRPELPVPRAGMAQEVWLSRTVGRRSVVGVGTILGGTLLVLAALSRHDAAAEYARAAAREFQKELRATDLAATPPQPTETALVVSAVMPAAQPVVPSAHPLAPSETVVAPLNTTSLPVRHSVNPPKAQPTKPISKVTKPGRKLEGAAFPIGWAENWPVFRGPNRGVTEALNLPESFDAVAGKGLLWSVEAPLPGWGSPVVWGGRVFLAGANVEQREVYCFDTARGTLIWKTPIAKSAAKSEPKVSEGTGYAPSTLATDGERVYAIFPNGDTAALDMSGKLVWTRTLGLPENSYGHASSLTLYGGGLIVQIDQGSDLRDGKSHLLALDARTGETVWETPRPVASGWSTPIVARTARGDQLVTCGNPWVISYDPRTGRELWRANCLKGDVVPSAALSNGRAVVCSQGAALSAISLDGSEDVTKKGISWTYTEDLPDIASPAAARDLIFLALSEGLVICIDGAIGKKIWDHDYHSMFHASPVIAGDRVIFLDAKGKVSIVEAGRAFKEAGFGSIGEDAEATPAVAQGRLFIRGVKHLFCIGAK